MCRALRANGVDAPAIFLTARGALADRLAGFHAGGDDYLTKPFALAELLVRVHALLRRTTGGARETPGLRLDAATHAVRADERSEALTPTELRLLAALVDMLRRGELVAAAWPDGAIVYDRQRRRPVWPIE